MSTYRNSYRDRPSPSTIKANLEEKVIEYLVKKGYNRTEQMLRQESSNLDKDGKPIPERVEDLGTQKYTKAFQLLSNWIDSNLDIYKVK
jgi:transcription initiation factor TFIID subunit 5